MARNGLACRATRNEWKEAMPFLDSALFPLPRLPATTPASPSPPKTRFGHPAPLKAIFCPPPLPLQKRFGHPGPSKIIWCCLVVRCLSCSYILSIVWCCLVVVLSSSLMWSGSLELPSSLMLSCRCFWSVVWCAPPPDSGVPPTFPPQNKKNAHKKHIPAYELRSAMVVWCCLVVGLFD